MRKDAREVSFKLIFEYLFKNEKNMELQIELGKSPEFKINEDDLLMIDSTYEGVTSKIEELRNSIKKYAVGFTIERMYKADVALLVLAMYEIKYCDDIPYAVSVNEVLDLSKKYSSEKSTSFINGILANYIKNGADADCETEAEVAVVEETVVEEVAVETVVEEAVAVETEKEIEAVEEV